MSNRERALRGVKDALCSGAIINAPEVQQALEFAKAFFEKPQYPYSGEVVEIRIKPPKGFYEDPYMGAKGKVVVGYACHDGVRVGDTVTKWDDVIDCREIDEWYIKRIIPRTEKWPSDCTRCCIETTFEGDEESRYRHTIFVKREYAEEIHKVV